MALSKTRRPKSETRNKFETNESQFANASLPYFSPQESERGSASEKEDGTGRFGDNDNMTDLTRGVLRGVRSGAGGKEVKGQIAVGRQGAERATGVKKADTATRGEDEVVGDNEIRRRSSSGLEASSPQQQVSSDWVG